MARGKNKTKKAVPAQTGTAPGTITVALNNPADLLFHMPDGRVVRLAGSNQVLADKSMGKLPPGAFGLTTIAKSDWEYIKKQYGTLPQFKLGLIFAHEKEDYAVAESKEKSGLRHGYEPLEANNDPRLGTRMDNESGGI
jgi:hypothetical protein